MINKPGNAVFALITYLYLFKKVGCAVCRYYPLLTDSPAYNTTCPDTCCSGYSSTPEGACCSNLAWNSGVYIGLSVPIFCCVASVLAGFFYCCLIVKPNTRFFSDRSRISNLRNRVVTPCESLPTVSVKDDPPTYNELFTNSLGSNESSIKEEINRTRISSPEPPPYSAQSSTNDSFVT